MSNACNRRATLTDYPVRLTILVFEEQEKILSEPPPSTQSDAIPPEAAERLLRCYYFSLFMNEAIVDVDYKPPVQLTTALKLTSRGSRIVNQIKSTKGVEIREAQAAVFITAWVGEELLIDLEGTDLETIRAIISSEIKRKKMRFPWIYGRMMYDRIAQAPFWGRSHPTADESRRLLDDMPQGVFQLGPYLSGPYGLFEVHTWRNIFYHQTIPGFHCEEVECNSIHGVHLTSGDYGINRALLSIREKLNRVGWVSDTYIDAVTDFEATKIPPYSWNNSSRLPYFLIDTCTENDLRLLLATLLDSTKGTLRGLLSTQLDIDAQSATEFAAKRTIAEMLQIVLMCKDTEIHTDLNRLIWSDKIRIEDGEVRRPRIAASGAGPLRVNIESSTLGARFKPEDHYLPIRLQQIIDLAFPRDDAMSQSRLNWLLRHFEGESPIGRLNVALSEAQPVDIIERLIVSDERTYCTALRALGLPPDALAHRSDHDIARLITWHTGFRTDADESDLNDLNGGIGHLRQVLGGLPASILEPSDIRKIREVSGRLFPHLERVLKSALQFTTWALLRDHYSNGYELAYSPLRGREFFAQWIGTRAVRIEASKVASMDLDLGELLTCFGSLAKYLREIESNRSNYRRPEAQWPRLAREASCPLDFPFRHTHPYLDLDRTYRVSLQATLEQVTAKLSKANVPNIRNRFLHDSLEVPDRDTINTAVNEIEVRISDLVGQGLYPLLFTLTGSNSDSYGRERFLLTSHSGLKIAIARPISTMLFGFPSLNSSQYVVVGGRLTSGAEPLRFRSVKDSPYRTLWEKDFPARPARRAVSSATDSAEGSIAGYNE